MNVRGVGRATIGNNCYFGAGCKVVGAVTIGDNVVVSANSVVVTDVPSGATVFGVPARVISREATSPYLKNPVAPVTPAVSAKVGP
jgi:serine O-acetyltransferase